MQYAACLWKVAKFRGRDIHRQKGRNIHPYQKIHASVALVSDYAYHPAANAHHFAWDAIIGSVKVESHGGENILLGVSDDPNDGEPQSVAPYDLVRGVRNTVEQIQNVALLEHDLFDIRNLPRLLDGISKGSNELEFMERVNLLAHTRTL